MTMKKDKVIQISPIRRLISHEYGWKLERLSKATDKKPEPTWVEDRPAWPGTLHQGLCMVVERVFAEEPDTDIANLSKQLEIALQSLENWKLVTASTAKAMLKELEENE